MVNHFCLRCMGEGIKGIEMAFWMDRWKGWWSGIVDSRLIEAISMTCMTLETPGETSEMKCPKLRGQRQKQGLNSVGTNLQKVDTTLNGNDPPKPRPGPLALLSLDTPSLTSPCYNVHDIYVTEKYDLDMRQVNSHCMKLVVWRHYWSL